MDEFFGIGWSWSNGQFKLGQLNLFNSHSRVLADVYEDHDQVILLLGSQLDLECVQINRTSKKTICSYRKHSDDIVGNEYDRGLIPGVDTSLTDSGICIRQTNGTVTLMNYALQPVARFAPVQDIFWFGEIPGQDNFGILSKRDSGLHLESTGTLTKELNFIPMTIQSSLTCIGFIADPCNPGCNHWFLGTSSRMLYCLREADGKLLWQVSLRFVPRRL